MSDAMTPSDAIGAYRESIAAFNVAPLWDVLKGMVPNEPRPTAVPYAWRWQQIREKLLEAGRLISAEQAERRVLMLKNPGLNGLPNITDTLYAGLQLILPGEIAPAHRHSQSAIRFVLEGTGGYTSVDGFHTDMKRGDLILTPPGVWHDHGNDGDGPVMWLDGLDVPLVTFLRAGFRDDHSDARYPERGSAEQLSDRYADGLLPIGATTSGPSSPIVSYPYAKAREVLARLAKHGELDPCHGAHVSYSNPLTGGAILPTLAASMRLVPKGHTTDWFKSVDGKVLVGMEGTTRIEIEGAEPVELAPNDVFAVPGWRSWRTTAQGAEDSVVFAYSDRPVYEKLDLYQERRGQDDRTHWAPV